MKSPLVEKIVYTGFKNEYGLPKNGKSINHKGFFDGFAHLGYKVFPAWYDEVPSHEYQKMLCNLVEEVGPDLVFCILQKDQISEETLTKIATILPKTSILVNWFGDDQWRFDNFSSRYANCFDAVITTDKYSLDKYREIGQRNVIRSQWASVTPQPLPSSGEYRYDISFIGGANAFRRWFVNRFEKAGLKVECFGDGWLNGRVTWDEMSEIFSRSKINLNISNSVNYDLRYVLSSPRSFINTIIGRKNISQTKARIFEIPAHGGFELTEYVPSLEDYFDIGKQIACYSTVDEAILQSRYYLDHESVRERIKVAGTEQAVKNHLFVNRIEHFMAELEGMMLAKLGDCSNEN